LIARDGTAAICQRIQSDRRVGDAGWLHRLRDDCWSPKRHRARTIRLSTTTKPASNISTLAAEYQAALNPDGVQRLARHLGLTANSLYRLGVGWAPKHRAWAFPMVDAAGNVFGIRLRGQDGSKFAVKGGREGLFIPDAGRVASASPLLVAEGPTDTAALLDLGFGNVVGRPSCTGGIKLLVELMGARRPQEVVVVADGDEPGLRGAANLASVLVLHAPVRVIQPPAGVKDVRAWLQAGATAEIVREVIQAGARRQLTVTVRKGR
jgi:phage/plasmid primase-like uncharacterized protein